MQMFYVRAQFKPTLLPSLLTAVTLLTSFLFSSAGFAHMRCESIMTQIPYGEIRSDYQWDNRHYTYEVDGQSEVKDQCNLGTCNLQSWVSYLEAHRNRTEAGPRIRLSSEYLSAYVWQKISFDAVDFNPNFKKPIDVDDLLSFSSDLLKSRRTIFNAGLMPAEAWTGGADFQTNPQANSVKENIRNIIRHLKIAEYKAKGDVNLVTQLRIDAKNEIQAIFEALLGPLPKTFIYNGLTYTPQQFQREFYPVLGDPLVKMEIRLDGNTHTTIQEFNKNSLGDINGRYDDSTKELYIVTNIDEMEKAAIFLLQHGRNVFFAYNGDWNYIQKSGLGSVDGIVKSKNGAPIDRKDTWMFTNWTTGGGHDIQLVGVEIDPLTGRATGWKGKNSAGDKAFTNGYMHFDSSFFHREVIAISFSRDSGVPLPRETATPNSEGWRSYLRQLFQKMSFQK
jgi:bleomycin hydrolase